MSEFKLTLDENEVCGKWRSPFIKWAEELHPRGAGGRFGQGGEAGKKPVGKIKKGSKTENGVVTWVGNHVHITEKNSNLYYVVSNNTKKPVGGPFTAIQFASRHADVSEAANSYSRKEFSKKTYTGKVIQVFGQAQAQDEKGNLTRIFEDVAIHDKKFRTNDKIKFKTAWATGKGDRQPFMYSFPVEHNGKITHWNYVVDLAARGGL